MFRKTPLVKICLQFQGEYTMDQLQMIMSNEKEVREREKEVRFKIYIFNF